MFLPTRIALAFPLMVSLLEAKNASLPLTMQQTKNAWINFSGGSARMQWIRHRWPVRRPTTPAIESDSARRGSRIHTVTGPRLAKTERSILWSECWKFDWVVVSSFYIIMAVSWTSLSLTKIILESLQIVECTEPVPLSPCQSNLSDKKTHDTKKKRLRRRTGFLFSKVVR